MITSPIQDDNEPQIVNAALEAVAAQASQSTDEVTYVDVPDMEAELEESEVALEVAIAEESFSGDHDGGNAPDFSSDFGSAFSGQEVSEEVAPSAGVELAGSELANGELDEQSQAVTDPFVGQWNTLVSQTNWEKGRIIAQWRDALVEAGAHVTTYSDETWSKQVGGVTSQHVGRLRRVHERFGATQKTYDRLYWGHFLAALDWDDAELWLEGAVSSTWSVSKMRKMRWESSGANPENIPRDEDVVASEIDGDFDQLVEEPEVESDSEDKDRIGTTGPLNEGPDFGDADQDNLATDSEGGVAMQTEDAPWEDADGTSDLGNPFANLPNLPPDVADALEQFKLCIVRHRSSVWADISQKTMLDVVGALQQFAMR